MNCTFYIFGIILILIVGLSICGDPQNITSFDPEEFDVNDLLNDPLVIEALESNKSNVEERPSSQELLEPEITPAKKQKRKSQDSRKLISIGISFKGNKRIPESFNTLQPANVNPENLSLSRIEMKFYEQGGAHPWRELEEYPVKKYAGYWAHVCDYFWVTKNPKDWRNRACYFRSLLFSENLYAFINYHFNRLPSTRAEVLWCNCHYYSRLIYKTLLPRVSFAIHKYRDNEYFILTKIRKGRITYEVSDFWTGVMLPIPFK